MSARTAGSDLAIRLLGPLEVDRGGQPVDVGRPQQRAVLAVLALEAGRVVSVERLITVLWGDDAPRSALNTLQSYVSRLRAALRPPDEPAGVAAAELIIGISAGYLLDVDPEQVDIARFRRLAAAGREASQAGDVGEAERQLSEALAIWRGDPLEGLTADGLASLVVRLDDERLDALGAWAEALLQLGRHETVVHLMREAVERDPLREALWARLALALYRSGRQADAVRAISSARDALADASGLVIGPELSTLEARILAQDEGLQLAAVETASLRAPMPGLVGRATEWATVMDAFDAVERGGAAVVLLEGEAGIGKSRLLDGVADAGIARGWTVLRGRCIENGLAPAMWPWIEIIRAAGGSYDDISTGGSFVELADAIAAVLVGVAGSSAAVVIVDDVHWADSATIDMLELVAARLGDAPLLIAAAYRPPDLGAEGPLPSRLGSLVRLPGARRIALAGLDRDDVALLIDAVAGRSPSDAEVDTVHRRTGGNPLFVSELSRFSATEIRDGDVPDLVRDVVRQRVAGLPDRTRVLLGVAAVLGESVDIRVVARAADVDIATCIEDLGPAADMRILTPDATGDVHFSHAIVRDALLVEMSSLRLASVHAAAADAIEAIFGTDSDHIEPIAVHRWAALSIAEPAPVSVSLIAAAEAARRHGALRRAAELAEMALVAAHRCSPEDARTTMEIVALEAFLAIETTRTFMTGGLEEIAERIEDLARSSGSAAATQLARFARWSDINRFPVPRFESIAADALDLAEHSDEPYVQILGHYVWAVQRWLAGDGEEAGRHFERAIAIRDAPERAAVRLPQLSLGYGAIAAAGVGDVERARQILAAEQLASLRDDRPGVVDVELAFMMAMVGVTIGDAAMVLRWARPVVDAPSAEFPLFTPACQVMHGWASVVQDGAADALEPMAKALAAFEIGGLYVGLSMFTALHGDALLRLGHVDDAIAVLEHSAEIAEDRSERLWAAQRASTLDIARRRRHAD